MTTNKKPESADCWCANTSPHFTSQTSAASRVQWKTRPNVNRNRPHWRGHAPHSVSDAVGRTQSAREQPSPGGKNSRRTTQDEQTQNHVNITQPPAPTPPPETPPPACEGVHRRVFPACPSARAADRCLSRALPSLSAALRQTRVTRLRRRRSECRNRACAAPTPTRSDPQRGDVFRKRSG